MGNYRFESFDTALEKANEWLEDYGPCDLEQPGKYFFAEEDTLEIIEERK